MESVLDECVENFPNILALKDEQKQAIFNNFTSSKGRGRDPSDWFRKEFHLPVSSVRQQQIKDNVVVLFASPLRLVFTSDGVGVVVVIISAERYDLVKIKPTESEVEYRFRL